MRVSISGHHVAFALRYWALALLAALALVGCNGGGGGGGTPPPPPTAPTPLSQAQAWADRPDLETASSLVMAGLQQIYGLTMTHDPQAIFEQHVADLNTSGNSDAAGALALFRRIYDGTAVLDSYYLQFDNDIDQRTLIALYCDSVAPPSDYRDALMAALDLGGYQTTHVLLAALFLRSNGCTGVLSASDLDTIDARVAALIDLGDGSLDDLDVEAMAFLAADGRMDLVPGAARDALLAAQQADGSWQEHTPLDGSGVSAPGFQHTTVLALWFLLVDKSGGVFVPISPPAA